MNEHLLQVSMSATEYLSLVNNHGRRALRAQYPDVFQAYKVAECPFCPRGNNQIQARLDTHSVDGWFDDSTYGFLHEIVKPCPHLVTTQHFLNLHGGLPTEFSIYRNHSEIPYVMPHVLKDTSWQPGPEFGELPLTPRAVMHALPVCRIENGKFVPNYTVFTVTYFAEYRDPVWYRHNQYLRELGKAEPRANDPDLALWWDLDYWVKQGKLRWLDADEEGLPIRQHPDPFPYGSIEGYPGITSYRNGEVLQQRPLNRPLKI